MKWSALALTLAATGAGSFAWSAPAHAQTANQCNNDIDCSDAGTECGGAVCQWVTGMPHMCVPAGPSTGTPASDSKSWCGANGVVGCKCAGATCGTSGAANHHCSFTLPRDAGASDAGSSSSGGGGDSGLDATLDSGGGSSGGSSSSSSGAGSSSSSSSGAGSSSSSSSSSGGDTGSSSSSGGGSSSSSSSGAGSSSSSSGAGGSSSSSGAAMDDGGTGATSSSSSCSCTTVGSRQSAPWGLGALALGASVVFARRRRHD